MWRAIPAIATLTWSSIKPEYHGDGHIRSKIPHRASYDTASFPFILQRQQRMILDCFPKLGRDVHVHARVRFAFSCMYLSIAEMVS